MKVLIGVWLLAATVLVNCYAGIIISAMTVPKMLPPIDSLEDLVRNDDVTIANQGDAILTLQYLVYTFTAFLSLINASQHSNPRIPRMARIKKWAINCGEIRRDS